MGEARARSRLPPDHAETASDTLWPGDERRLIRASGSHAHRARVALARTLSDTVLGVGKCAACQAAFDALDDIGCVIIVYMRMPGRDLPSPEFPGLPRLHQRTRSHGMGEGTHGRLRGRQGPEPDGTALTATKRGMISVTVGVSKDRARLQRSRWRRFHYALSAGGSARQAEAASSGGGPHSLGHQASLRVGRQGRRSDGQ
jgi:hypothetical protein